MNITALVSKLGKNKKKKNILWYLKFKQEQLKQLRQHAKSYAIGKEEDLEKNEVVMLVMQFLLGAGSLIRIGNKLIIPNNEQRNILQFYITEYYYKRRYAFDIHLLQKIADQLEKIVFGGNEDPKLLIDALCKMYNAVRKGRQRKSWLNAQKTQFGTWPGGVSVQSQSRKILVQNPEIQSRISKAILKLQKRNI